MSMARSYTSATYLRLNDCFRSNCRFRNCVLSVASSELSVKDFEVVRKKYRSSLVTVFLKYQKKALTRIGELDRINMSEKSTNDEYAHVAKGPLKLKSDPSTIKKKKKKKKEKKMIEMAKIIEEEKPRSVELKRTKAELAFQKMQEKMQTERINQKASMTHKQRVEEFNRHLDSLTEHFDIPKVSWTK